MSNIDELDRLDCRETLMRLEDEHATLDRRVAEYALASGIDQLELSRLKRRKLELKDAIVRLRSNVLPDLPA